jgi:hypothetical protein
VQSISVGGYDRRGVAAQDVLLAQSRQSNTRTEVEPHEIVSSNAFAAVRCVGLRKCIA